MFKTIIPVFALAVAAVAQTADAGKFYKLDFVVKEVEGGKTVNSRAYSTMLAVQTSGGERIGTVTIRAGAKVQVPNAGFYDVGTNIDVKALRESQSDVSLDITADLTTLVTETPSTSPVLRQNRWSGTTLVPVKKPTVVFSSDDPSSKRQLQLEVTATPVK